MNSLKTLCITNLLLNEEKEQKLINACVESAKAARKSQGVPNDWDRVSAPLEYKWMWWRWISELSYGNDFSWRVDLPPKGVITTGVDGMKVFSKSNLSMNTPADHHAQLKIKINRAVLKDHRFFGHKIEGREDEVYAKHIEYIQRRLRFRSKKTNFKSTMESAISRALLTGEQVLVPTYSYRTKYVPKEVRVALDVNGEPIITKTDKTFVTEDDVFVDNHEDGRSYLERDKSISKRIGSTLVFSENPMKILQPEKVNNGASFDKIHPFDFICDTRWETVDEADYKGNDMTLTIEEIESLIEEYGIKNDAQFESYKQLVQNGSPTLSHKNMAKVQNGEVDEDSIDGTSGAGAKTNHDGMMPRILVRQQFIKIDILDVGARQDVWVLMDVRNEIPIAYKYADDVLETGKDVGHPYIVIRNEDVIDRWYGSPIYQKMWDDMIHIDTRLNQSNLEVDSSGNVIIVNGSNLKGWEKDKTIRIRDNIPNEVKPSFDPREVIHVETITPQIQEIENSLNLALQRAASKNGLSGAGQTITKALPGTETATGQQILEDAQNAVLESLVNELAKGVDKAINAFSKIELDNMDYDDLQKQIGIEGASMVKEWIEKNKGQYDYAIEVLIAAITDTTTLNKNMQAMSIIEKWMSWPQVYQAVHKQLFSRIMESLDVENPDQYLIPLNEIAAQQQPGSQQPAAQPSGQQQQQQAPVVQQA